MNISLLSLTLGMAGLEGPLCPRTASDDHMPSTCRMLLSRARFYWEEMGRDMKYAKTCPRAPEGIAGRLDSLSSLQSGNSSLPALVRRSRENGWRVCGMSYPVPCHPSNSSVRIGAGGWAWGLFSVRAEKGSFTVVREGPDSVFCVTLNFRPEKSTHIAHYCQKVPSAPSSSMQLSS